MKTNTTKLRRALTAFAMTGAMLAVSELNALEISSTTSGPVAANNANVTIAAGSDTTIDSGEKRLLSGSGTNTLDGTGYTFTNGSVNGYNSAKGGLINGGSWTINGGTYKNSATGTSNTGPSDNISYGGAVCGTDIVLKDVTFDGNSASSGNTPQAQNGTQAYGGAVAGNTVKISGTSTFTNNITSSGVFAADASYSIGGAVATVNDYDNGTVTLTVGETGVTDTILFEGNQATNLYNKGGNGAAQGGALGTNEGSILIQAESGDSIKFVKNIVNSVDNKSQGGAISVARQDAFGLTINAAKGSEVLFDGNQVILESGTRAYGGAIYSRGGIGSTDLTNITFNDNGILMNSLGGTKGQGGAVFVHKGGDLNVSDSTFTGNYIKNTVSEGTANGDIVYGGALASSEGSMNLTGTNSFEGNYVSSILGNAYGGAMAVEPGADHAITISGNNTFESNTASGAEAYGGAIFGQDITFDANSTSVFDGNSVTGGTEETDAAAGGAVAGLGNITLNGNNTFKYNTASGGDVNGGAVYAKNNLTLTGKSLFVGNSTRADDPLGSLGGAVYAERGLSISGAEFYHNSAGVGGAAFSLTGQNVPISNSIFAYNKAENDGGAIGVYSLFLDGNAVIDISDSTFIGNEAGGLGGAVQAHRGTFALSGTNVFEDNHAGTLGGALSADTSLDSITPSTITGNNLFINNSAKQSGGAIWTYSDLVFSGDDSKAVFTGNTADGKPNDILAEGDVSFKGKGEYSFDGGIVAETMGINGSDVTFEEGSQTDINGAVTLENATLNIATDGTEKTKFEVGSITDKGGNTLNIDYTGTKSGTVISGDTSGLTTRPNVNYTAMGDGQLAFTAQAENKDLVVTTKTAEGTYARLSGSVAQTLEKEADNLADLGTATAGDEIVVTKAPTAKTAGLTANGALSFRSNNTTARTIESDGSTLVSGASDLTLNNVTLKSNSSENAVVKGDSVNLTGKGTAGISAPKAIESTNGVTLDGKLTVDGAITGNTTIADDAEITVTQRTDVTGALNVGDAKVTIDGLGMTWVDHEDKDGNVSKVPQVDRIDVTDAISFAKDAVIEISFDETFNLDAPGTYEIMKGTSLTNDGAEFSFVDAIAQLNNDMLQLSVVDGALMLDVKGFGTVPEPSTWALLILGGLGVFGVARKNRKAKK